MLSGIASSDVAVSRDGDSKDAVLTIGSTGKALTIVGQYSADDYYSYAQGVRESIASADGMSWSADDLRQAAIASQGEGSAGSVWGFGGRADTLVAGAGDKYMNGGNAGTYNMSADTYV